MDKNQQNQAQGRKRVLCPVERDGKTYWKDVGAAFENRDASLNIYLDLLPVNGRLQIREWDDPPWKRREEGGRALALPAVAINETPF